MFCQKSVKQALMLIPAFQVPEALSSWRIVKYTYTVQIYVYCKDISIKCYGKDITRNI